MSSTLIWWPCRLAQANSPAATSRNQLLAMLAIYAAGNISRRLARKAARGLRGFGIHLYPEDVAGNAQMPRVWIAECRKSSGRSTNRNFPKHDRKAGGHRPWQTMMWRPAFAQPGDASRSTGWHNPLGGSRPCRASCRGKTRNLQSRTAALRRQASKFPRLPPKSHAQYLSMERAAQCRRTAR